MIESRAELRKTLWQFAHREGESVTVYIVMLQLTNTTRVVTPGLLFGCSVLCKVWYNTNRRGVSKAGEL